MSRETVTAGGAPEPAGPYPHAVVANGFVYVSGQGPVDPETGSAPDGFEDQVHQAFENLRAILEAARSGLGEVVKVNAYLTDLTRFGRFDEVYGEYFAQDPPARTTVGSGTAGHPRRGRPRRRRARFGIVAPAKHASLVGGPLAEGRG